VSSIERLSTLLSQSAVRPTGAVDTNRTDTNTWITDQVDFTTPIHHPEGQLRGHRNGPGSTRRPQLHDRTPTTQTRRRHSTENYDTGDHVNLTANGYLAATATLDLTALGLDN